MAFFEKGASPLGTSCLGPLIHVGISAGSAVWEMDSRSASGVPRTMAKGLTSLTLPLMDLAWRDILDLGKLLIPQSRKQSISPVGEMR